MALTSLNQTGFIRRPRLRSLVERPLFFAGQNLQIVRSRLTPFKSTEREIFRFEQSMSEFETRRFEYYLKTMAPFDSEYAHQVGDFVRQGYSFYYYDFAPWLHLFPNQCAFNVIFGDVTDVPAHPSFVKSRPIGTDNQNAVVLKLDSLRHFRFFQDDLKWQQKSTSAVWRGHAHNVRRQHLIKQYQGHAFIDAAQTNGTYSGLPPAKPHMSVANQLKHQFVLSIEGYDVATNLKWIMASNSLAVSPKLKYETWFLEGWLVPGEHFVEIAEDFSDLEEKIEFYAAHPKFALEMIENAQAHVRQFLHPERERMLNILVMYHYFKRSGQI